MSTETFFQRLPRYAAVLVVVLASGCGSLLPKGPEPPSVYSLDGVPNIPPVTQPTSTRGTAPSLVVNPTRAAPGFDSPHIVYVRVAHQLEHFAHNEWVDTPARMLEPRIVAAIERAGGFRSVAPSTSGIAGDLRLDTEVLRLQQEFGGGPSRVRFTLRASLLDNTTRQVISWREFDETAAADSETPYGGVVAANRVVQVVMEQLSRYCSHASERWQARTAVVPKSKEQTQPVR